MTSTAGASLVEQRRMLRERLLAQRQLIADQLGTAPETNGGYPRSKAMRFLTKRPAVAATLLAELAALLLGKRYFKSMTAVLALTKIVRSASTAKPRQPSAIGTTDQGTPPGS